MLIHSAQRAASTNRCATDSRRRAPRSGQTLVEYALVITLIASALLGTLKLLGNSHSVLGATAGALDVQLNPNQGHSNGQTQGR